MILGVTNYDPPVVTTWPTSALIAMTAIDPASLAVTFTVPISGAVTVRIGFCVNGSTAYPSILMGILDGSTVIHRQAPMAPYRNSATSLLWHELVATITGLAPGATLTWAAAYSVETAVASTAVKCGGPDDAVAGSAFGAAIMEVWGA